MNPEDTAHEVYQRSGRAIVSTERFLTVLRAAERCGVSPRTMRNWIKSGAVIAVRLPPGRGSQKRWHHRISAAEVEKIASRSTPKEPKESAAS